MFETECKKGFCITRRPFKYEVHGYLSTRLKTLGAHPFGDFQKSIQFRDYTFTANDTFEELLEIGFGARCSIIVSVEVLQLEYEINGSLCSQ